MPEGSVRSGVKISVCRLFDPKQQQHNLQLERLGEKQVHGVEWDVQLYEPFLFSSVKWSLLPILIARFISWP